MRITTLALAPLLLAASITPAAAQVSATIHIGPIRLGGGDYHHHGYPPRIVVVDYPHRHFGPWQRTAVHWRPITVYYLDGHYYDRPWRSARPVVIYRYRDNYFFGPRHRDWDRYRSRYEQREWRVWRDHRGGWRDDWRDDRRDRYEDRFDRREDRWDRREDRWDRREDRFDRRDDRRDGRPGGNIRRNEYRDGRPGGNIRRNDGRDLRPAVVGSRGNPGRGNGNANRARRPNGG